VRSLVLWIRPPYAYQALVPVLDLALLFPVLVSKNHSATANNGIRRPRPIDWARQPEQRCISRAAVDRLRCHEAGSRPREVV
jgi:hypothetical protein